MADNGLNELVHSIEQAPRETAKFLRKAIEMSARNIKTEWRASAARASHLYSSPSSVNYDMHGSTGALLGDISAEIGPEKGRFQSRFLGIVENGAPTTPAKKFGQRALLGEASGLEDGIRKAVQDGLEAAGL